MSAARAQTSARAWLAVGTLAAWMVLALVAARLNWLRVALLEQARLEGVDHARALQDVAARMDGLGAVELALLGPTFAAFAAWLYRAHANLPLLGARHCQYTPRWAVLAWLVPGMNLYRPYLVVREVWLESHAERAAPRTMVAWWGLGLSGLFARWFAHRMTTAGLPEIRGALLAAYVWLFAASALGVSALCAIRLVADTTRRQLRALERGG
jgi:hypothetical protein